MSDARTLVSAAPDGTVHWWDPATGQPRGQPWRSPRCLREAHLTPDGRSLLVGCSDGRVRLFDLASREPYPTSIPIEFNLATSLLLSPDATTVLVVHSQAGGDAPSA